MPITMNIFITFHACHVGGILSLLTGMSFLSLFEIIFWLLRLPPTKDKQLPLPKKSKENQENEVRKLERSPTTIGNKILEKPESFQSSLRIKESYNQYY